MNISIVVPSYNESESLPELCSWIDKVMQANNFTYEVMIVDDGSTDDSWDVIQKIREKNSSVKGVKFRRNYGKSAALNIAFERVEGDVAELEAPLNDLDIWLKEHHFLSP
jgi:glycosyltransferase involved in cell wall biosynthesis